MVVSDTVDVAADAPDAAQDVVAVDAADVAADNVVPDGGACDPLTIPEEFFVDPTARGSQIEFSHADLTGFGGDSFTSARVRIWQARDTSVMTMGDCRYYDTTVNPARTAYQDLGNVSISYGGMTGTLMFDTSTMTYVPMGFDAFNLGGETDAHYVVAGSDAGVAADLTLRMPQIPADTDVVFTSDITDVSNGTVSRTADTVITWTPRAASDEIMHVSFATAADFNAGAMVVCAVRSCAGRIVVPSAMVSTAFPAGADVIAVLSFLRMAPLPPTGRTPPATVLQGYRKIFGLIAN